jgi:hypothetical protein
MRKTWFDEEPRLGDGMRNLARLLARGVRRPWLTLLVAFLGAGVVTAAVAFGKHSYAPRLVLRVVEGSGVQGGGASVKRRLADYVRDGIFTSEPLLALIRRHGLYPSLARNNPRAAIDSFREDIDVDVYQNYFVEQLEPGKSPRSARVALSYHSPDRDKALAVTRDLGKLVQEHELRLRREQAELAAADADGVRDALRVAVQRRAVEVAAKQNEVLATTAPDPAAQVELVGLLASLGSLERDLDTATHRAASYELGAALEGGGVGLRVEVADDAMLPSGDARLRFLCAMAGVSWLLGLPLSAVAVGAFFSRRSA